MILYLDTSSLLKLYVEEVGSHAVRSRVDEADVVATSVIAYPEAHAAAARRYREGALTKREFGAVLEEFRDTWPRYLAVLLSVPVYVRAGTLAVKHGLRGMDAVHLASYTELLNHGDDVEFMSHDNRLTDAAHKQRRLYRKPS
jgi:predicted nucleic acid-binding protein